MTFHLKDETSDLKRLLFSFAYYTIEQIDANRCEHSDKTLQTIIVSTLKANNRL